jgi:hypothetical protein
MSFTINSTVYDRPDLADAFQQINVNKIKYAFDKTCPYLVVNKKNGTIEVIQRDSLMTAATLTRNATDTYAQVNADVHGLQYSIDNMGAEFLIGADEGTVIQANRETTAMASLKAKLIIALEQAFATSFFDTGVIDEYDTALDWTTTSSDILAQILDAKSDFIVASGGVIPNCLTVAQSQFDLLFKNEKIRAAYPAPMALTFDTVNTYLAGVLGLDKVVVSSVMATGSAGAESVVPETHALLSVSCADGDDVSETSLSRSLIWNVNGDTSDNPYKISNYFNPTKNAVAYQLNAYISSDTVFDASFGLLIPTTGS